MLLQLKKPTCSKDGLINSVTGTLVFQRGGHTHPRKTKYSAHRTAGHLLLSPLIFNRHQSDVDVLKIYKTKQGKEIKMSLKYHLYSL